jgi:hypothetical protein
LSSTPPVSSARQAFVAFAAVAAGATPKASAAAAKAATIFVVFFKGSSKEIEMWILQTLLWA